MKNENAANPMEPPKSGKLSQGAVLLGIILLLGTFLFPSTNGERWDSRYRVEFSPSLVAHRETVSEDSGRFSENVRWRIFRTHLEQYLVDEEIIKPTATPESADDWILIKSMGEGGHNGFIDGDGRQVCLRVGCASERSIQWVEWTKKNKKPGKDLWRSFYAKLRKDEVSEGIFLLIKADGPDVYGMMSPMPRCSNEAKSFLAEFDSRKGK